MEVMQRRKATPEELKQGMEQMMAAQERLSKEATEEPIEDIPGSHSDVAQEKEPRLEDAKEFLDVGSEGIEMSRDLAPSPQEGQKAERSSAKRLEDSRIARVRSSPQKPQNGSQFPPLPRRVQSPQLALLRSLEETAFQAKERERKEKKRQDRTWHVTLLLGHLWSLRCTPQVLSHVLIDLT